MKKVFAILQEPASYTTDRNAAVYDKLGVDYCYIESTSLAKASQQHTIEALSSLSFVQLIKKIKAILRQNDIVIINGYTNKIFVIAFILNILYNKKIGIDSDTPLNIPANTIKRLVKQLYLTAIFKNKRVYGLSGGTMRHKDLFRHYGMKEDHIYLMPMVVNNDNFKFNCPRNNSTFTFLFVGRIIDVKNINLLIQSFKSAFHKNDNVVLRIVGDGILKESLQTQFEQDSNIIFVGAKYGDDLRNEYIQASAFILPSYYEPWGLVVNEAMAAGLPVIVSDQVGAGPDLVADKETGFIFRYDDAEDLKDKMLRLVSDKELYLRYSKNAYNRLNNEWNYEFYTKCLNEFINQAGQEGK